jgi:hypothetical protein
MQEIDAEVRVDEQLAYHEASMELEADSERRAVAELAATVRRVAVDLVAEESDPKDKLWRTRLEG